MPVGELVGVVDRLGPANLGYRLRWGRRRDGLDLNFENTVRAIDSRIALGTLAEDAAAREPAAGGSAPAAEEPPAETA